MSLVMEALKTSPRNIYRVDVIRNAAIRRRRERISRHQHISSNVIGIRDQNICRAIDEVCFPGFEAVDQGPADYANERRQIAKVYLFITCHLLRERISATTSLSAEVICSGTATL